MKRNVTVPLFLLGAMVWIGFSGCATTGHASKNAYAARDAALYDTIVHLDSLFFAAYNTCDVHLDEYAAFYSDSIEFYYDYGYFTSKSKLVKSTQMNVCGKVIRKLVKGSIEVHGIPGYGAVEIGDHRILSHTEKGVSRTEHFVIMWHRTAGGWLVTRLISVH